MKWPDHPAVHESRRRVPEAGVEDPPFPVAADPTDGIIAVGAGADIAAAALVQVRLGDVDAQQHVHPRAGVI